MKLLSFFLGAALVLAIKGQYANDCFYDYICDDAGSAEDLVMSAPSPLACYEACKAYNDDGANTDTCDHWTYYEEMGFGREFDDENDTEVDSVDGKLKRRGKPVCRRLTGCGKKFSISGCASAVGGVKCASGPGSCEPCDKCPKLNFGDPTSATEVRWYCNINQPYTKDSIPAGTICRAECGSTSWTSDGTTNEPVSAEATCRSTCKDTPAGTEGEWVVTPTGATDGTLANEPLSPIKDSVCECEPITLDAYQLPGASVADHKDDNALLYCDPSAPLVDGGNTDQNGAPILDTMDSTSRCQLFCHEDLRKDISCNAGFWTADVKTKLDVNCFNFPEGCLYTDSIDPYLCKCADASVPPNYNVCTPGQACLSADGTCQDACPACSVPPCPASDPCFCEGSMSGKGVSCAIGETCDPDGNSGNGVCA